LNAGTFCCLLALVYLTQAQQNVWREDGRCGAKFPLPGGRGAAKCNPLGNGPRKGPCCSSKGFCGNTVKHCQCSGCQDFSKLQVTRAAALLPTPKPLPLPVEVPQVVQGVPQEVSGGTWGGWWEGWIRRWEEVQELLPSQVSSYLEETASEGVRVLEDIYDDTKQGAIEKSSVQLDEITNILERFGQRLEDLYQSAKQVVEQETVLTDSEIQDRADAGDLFETKEELDSLKEVLVKEREENFEFEGVEAILQRLITTVRELLSTADGQADLGWSKLKQLELEFYQASQLVASTSGQVKVALEEAFNTLNKELEEAAPAVTRFLDAVSPK